MRFDFADLMEVGFFILLITVILIFWTVLAKLWGII